MICWMRALLIVVFHVEIGLVKKKTLVWYEKQWERLNAIYYELKFFAIPNSNWDW